MAHTEIAVITYNATFNNDGKHLNQDSFQNALDGAKNKKTINLTNQAIEQNAGKGDMILHSPNCA